MKKALLILALVCFSGAVFSQQPIPLLYNKTSVMIPMRDGVQLYTVILTPVNNSQTYPFLIQRTPYSADSRLPSEN